MRTIHTDKLIVLMATMLLLVAGGLFSVHSLNRPIAQERMHDVTIEQAIESLGELQQRVEALEHSLDAQPSNAALFDPQPKRI